MSSIRQLTEEEQEQLRTCGSVGFSYREVAIVFALQVREVQQQFEAEEGEIYEAYMKGRLQAELELRQTVLASAKNGSTPMLEKMLAFFKRTDDIHREL